ncbi:hypothetical protein [Sphingomicrobium astaxanthinifaciens]|uniref:hypothetical protein n=1 Tax=Sphingomicrobium astaxanthinifaciens TaxID=1227949 RepID=UPI001FCAD50F|nr:hypothetical protein [Sphingomicrobium astaxanthinifaciens]MCJ7421537.1 hypothetical protein [Sphingomicrobium astaxanthinifaciens]
MGSIALLSCCLCAASLALIPPTPPPVIAWDDAQVEAMHDALGEEGTRLGMALATAEAQARRAVRALDADSSDADIREARDAMARYTAAFGAYETIRLQLKAMELRLPTPLSEADADKVARLIVSRYDLLNAAARRRGALEALYREKLDASAPPIITAPAAD